MPISHRMIVAVGRDKTEYTTKTGGFTQKKNAAHLGHTFCRNEARALVTERALKGFVTTRLGLELSFSDVCRPSELWTYIIGLIHSYYCLI